MALARVQYEQTEAGNRNFTVTMPYISRDHIKVSVNAEDVSFRWLNGATVQLDTAPTVGDIIDIRRETERNNLLVDFQDASTITERQLDLLASQTFYLAQEAFDLTGSSLTVHEDGSYSASGRRISLLGYPQYDGDAATQGYVKNVLVSGRNAHEERLAAERARVGAENAEAATERTRLDAVAQVSHLKQLAEAANDNARDAAVASSIFAATSLDHANNAAASVGAAREEATKSKNDADRSRSEADRAKTEADRAKANADELDPASKADKVHKHSTEQISDVTEIGRALMLAVSQDAALKAIGAAAFPAGTRMLFVQASAPTGWTKVTTHDNKALRIVSGTGGGSGGSHSFTTALNSPRPVAVTVNNHTLSEAQMPYHIHSTTITLQGWAGRDGTGGELTTDIGPTAGRAYISSGAGGGGAHNHSASGSLNLDVQYVDAIIAQKD